MILPYMEQTSVFNAFNFYLSSLPDRGNPNNFWYMNTTAAIVKINTFICPSDTDRITPDASGFSYGHMSYRANSGSAPNVFYGGLNNTVGSTGPAAGLFQWVATNEQNQPQRGQPAFPGVNFAAITDGLSNTAAFSEHVLGIGASNTYDPLKPSSMSVQTTQNSTNDSTPQEYYNICLQSGGPTPTAPLIGEDSEGSKWFYGYCFYTRYNHVMPPNSWGCQDDNSAGTQAAIPPSSRHPGVVNTLMADGSVKAIKSTININTFWALGTRAGGEVISADAL